MQSWLASYLENLRLSSKIPAMLIPLRLKAFKTNQATATCLVATRKSKGLERAAIAMKNCSGTPTGP